MLLDKDTEIENSPTLCIHIVLEVMEIIYQEVQDMPLNRSVNRLEALSNLDIIFGNICNESNSIIEIMYYI